MKNKLFLFLMATVFGVSAHAASLDAAASLDVAESSLRTLLNQGSNGNALPKELRTPEEKNRATARLLQIENRYPGLLEGKIDLGMKSEQYEIVKGLYDRFQNRYKD